MVSKQNRPASSSVRTLIVAALCILTMALTGCAWENTNSDKKQKLGKQKVMCVRDAPTGSHITQLVCYRKTDVKARRQNDRERVRNLQIGGAVVPSGSNNN